MWDADQARGFVLDDTDAEVPVPHTIYANGSNLNLTLFSQVPHFENPQNEEMSRTDRQMALHWDKEWHWIKIPHSKEVNSEIDEK